MTYFPLHQTTCFFIPLVAPCKPLLLSVERVHNLWTTAGNKKEYIAIVPFHPASDERHE